MPEIPPAERAADPGGRFGRRISKESVSQQAYLAIRTSLMRSQLRPGQKLIARQVAADLGISVTPVRESLLRLVSEHVLMLDERGTVVVPQRSLQDCIEIRDLRVLTEGEGAARAAAKGSVAEVDALLATHDRYVMAEAGRDYVTALAENENFHFSLCRMAQSPALFRIVENLWMQFGPILSSLYDGRGRPFDDQVHGHIVVIEALRARDPERARQAIGQDILVGGRALLDRLADGQGDGADAAS